MTPLEAAHKSLGVRASIPFDEFAKAVADWEVVPVHVSGEVAGAVMIKGHEIHACILESYKSKWISKKLYKMIFVDRLNEFGKLTTSVSTACEQGMEFVKRCGFVCIGENNGVARYERCLDGH